MKRWNLVAVAAMIVLTCSGYARESYQTQMQSALNEIKIPSDFNVSSCMKFETFQNGDPRLLEEIAPWLQNAPKSDLSTLMGGETQLTPANYLKVIAPLFRLDDLDSWYHASSERERQEYRQTIQKEYERYTTLPNVRTPEQFQKFLDFFNYAMKSGQNKFTREWLRRLLTSSASVAYYLDDEKVKTNKITVAQVWEYLILSWVEAVTYFKITNYTGDDVVKTIVPDISKLQAPDKPLNDLLGKQAKIDNFFEKGVKKISLSEMVAEIESIKSQKGLDESRKGLDESRKFLREADKFLREADKGLREADKKWKAYDIIIKFQELANQELKNNSKFMSKELMTSFNETKKAIEYLKTIQKGDMKVWEVIALVEPLIKIIEKKLA